MSNQVSLVATPTKRLIDWTDESFLIQYYEHLDLELVKETYFDLVSESWEYARKFLSEACKKDPFVLAWVLWPDREFKPFHRIMFETGVYNKESLTLSPRGAAKSTVMITLMAIWVLVNNRDVRIGVLSTSKPKANEFMTEVDMLLRGDAIKALFGQFVSPRWSESRGYYVLGRKEGIRGASLAAYGTSSSTITGAHFDLLLLDDIVTQDLSESFFQRCKFERWMSRVFKGLTEAHTVVINVGTRYHPEDYWNVLIQRGIPMNPENTRGAWVDEEKRITLWPEKMPPEFLDKWLADEGKVAFQLQMMNQTEGLDGVIFRRLWIHPWQGRIETGSRTVLALDTAYKMASKNDYSAIVVLTQLTTGDFIVRYANRGKWSIHEIEEHVHANYKRYSCRHVVIEVFIKNKMANQDRNFLVQRLRKNIVQPLPVMTYTPDKDKVSRYWLMSQRYESHQFFHAPGLKSLEDEMVAAPNGAHDDQLDALWMAWHYFNRAKSSYTKLSKDFLF